MNNKRNSCSIIVPVYFNEGSLTVLFDKLQKEVIEKINKSIEVIFIDDGSGDNSLNELLDIQLNNPDLVKVIKLTRNFGQLSAIYAGYQKAKGECLITISADLQDPPSLIVDMINAYYDENYEIVICHRQSRDESWYRRKTSAFFYGLIKKIIVSNMPKGGFDFFLISQKVKNAILLNNERNPFLQAQVLLTGYKYKLIQYHRSDRLTGKSKWTFSKKIKYLIDGILAYSYLPIRLMTVLGVIIAVLGFLYAIVIVFAKFFHDTPFKGWAPLMVLILVLSGIQMLMLGIIGEYLWRTLDQVRNRPYYIVEKVFEKD